VKWAVPLLRAATSWAATLVTTPEAARQLGISARTIQRYVQAGLITPDLRLPSGRYRWDVERLREQINSLPVARDDE
jgi:DNA-binding transcriptional MerR regulator